MATLEDERVSAYVREIRSLAILGKIHAIIFSADDS